ncbi:MAG: glycosyltransferase [Lentisphaeria bacterium]|nr:glycosyltransferase [Lentisphaeria bacterium]
MHYPLISIIVPVYQVEKYLEKCINSIIAQTYKNLEIILVDDGSTDNCPAICNRFQAEDSRIKVIHQENGGLSHARNVGVEHATGDFIGFVDSDDWIEPNMYEVLMSALQETGADIPVSDRQMEFEGSQPVQINVKKDQRKLYSSEEAVKNIIKGGGIIRNSVWNKLYRRTVLANISFTEGKIHEDILWTPKIVSNACLLSCSTTPLYHYLQRPKSLSHNDEHSIKKMKDKIEMVEQRTKYICNHYPSLKKLAILKLQNTYCYEFVKISLNNSQLDSDGKIRHTLFRQFCQLGLLNIHINDGIRTTIDRILFRFCPNLLVKIYDFL